MQEQYLWRKFKGLCGGGGSCFKDNKRKSTINPPWHVRSTSWLQLRQQFLRLASAREGVYCEKVFILTPAHLFGTSSLPPCTPHMHILEVLQAKSKTFCKWLLSVKAKKKLKKNTLTPLPLSPVFAPKNVILLNIDGHSWCKPPFKFLAKCFKINGVPRSLDELRWSAWKRKQAHAKQKMGTW